MKRNLLKGIHELKSFTICLLFLLISNVSMAQVSVKGQVIDAITRESIIGATVSIKGTATSTITNTDGKFVLNTTAQQIILVVNYLSYNEKEISLKDGERSKFNVIELESNMTSISEVFVRFNSMAIDRKTPVAVSTINASLIEEKLGSQEFPELLNSTPGVYATRAGGGFGDSRLNLRGFQSENVAVMINGVPVNGMENGKIYWSNWAGLSEVTRFMQVQRGLGASKVAVPSIGGTINIATKTIDATKGGHLYQGFGNDGYNKTSFSYSSGLMDNGWAFSVLGSKNTGNGWMEGGKFEAYNYFFNVSKKINEAHTLALTAFGAPQNHSQRFDRLTIQEYRDAPQGLKYNANWGVLNGEYQTISQNEYHKPQISLNHNWTINSTSSLSTSAYASIATGGSTIDAGSLDFNTFRTNGAYSPIDIDAIVQQNIANPDGSALGYLRTSVNDHQWYGVLSTYTKKVNDRFDILAGIDGRYYRGKHYQTVSNLLGAKYVADNSDLNNPYNRATVGDRVSFDNDGVIGWGGAFLQGEYSHGPLSTFVTLSGSNSSYQRIDYFKFLDSDTKQKSEVVNTLGYQVKGGANYNINTNHNVFANIGYFEKAPFFNAVFMNNSNTVNEAAEREKIMSYELGYGFRTSTFSANINAYHTAWKDKSFTRSFQNDGINYFGNFLGVDALHKGIELDFNYRPTNALNIKGMVSVGDWKWTNNLPQLQIFDEAQNPVGQPVGPIYMKDIKVGDSPQTSMFLGVNYDVFESLKLGIDYNYFANFHSDFNPTTLIQENMEVWKVPNYSLLGVNAVLKLKIAGLKTSLFANVNNLLDTEYISDGYAIFSPESASSSRLISNSSNTQVYYGVGRTWTTGLKINF
ncbi:TonB-dependent receptor [Sphingobacterium bovistauri]|uniref:TonB-dependent receptor n=1 Tax=Sphingobacterium bovistauri TaxID=2781959 RepID=A0ABS7Z495_9SPHI|nr:TonB-dependent receptor [Sphingobacterium bovistauri]MCA5004833.1 TonB-dependent receptor [Sphingobacterium bovistauri]